MENKIYDVDFFIRKFERTPEQIWLVGDYTNDEETQFCALGLCGARGFGWNDEARALHGLFMITFQNIEEINIGKVNDGKCTLYQQPTPKARILAALYDIYEKTYGRKYQQPEQSKEKTVYKTVVIDSAVKELQETLTEN